jgi:hypothetical protein
MKLTREQFKELVQLYQEAWDKFSEYSNYWNENSLSECMFPIFDWIGNQTGLRQLDGEFDILGDLVALQGQVPINVQWFDLPDGEKDYECEYTSDLDKIYDYYFGGEQ